MDKRLLMQVRLLDDRYHGTSEWPPAPARLFQALVAGNTVGAHLPDDCADALRWLETLPVPPEIRAQRGRLGLKYANFVPNNDLDAKGGDPKQVANIRVRKFIQPRHIDASQPITYSWCFQADTAALRAADCVRAMADNLYQLGRGIDMAWARAEVLDAQDGDSHFEAASGDIFRPGAGTGAMTLACPQDGSLASLLLRFQANRRRFKPVTVGNQSEVHFTNPPKARFWHADYNPSMQWRLFDLRKDGTGAFHAWLQERVVSLVERIRDRAVERLTDALPDQTELIERILVGSHATEADKAHRVRLIPLPSIGHDQTNRAIRRILLMVPADCPLPFGDIEWAFSGLALDNPVGHGTLLVAAGDLSMLRHYALESGERYRVWRSVTAVALPQSAARRRINPKRRLEEAKSGEERSDEEQRACVAAIQALRHADVRANVESIRVQREPFNNKGARAEAFAEDTRFAKGRLWHVELKFAESIAGPLVIGDGRYLGLGVFEPMQETQGVFAFRIVDGLASSVDPEQLARALRNAVMSRVQQLMGPRQTLPSFFTGHAHDGSPLRDGYHRHLVYVADLPRQRLLVIAPHVLEGRNPTKNERINMGRLDNALGNLSVLRAGKSGKLILSGTPTNFENDPLFGHWSEWESVTNYQVTRHAKRMSSAEALKNDVLHETLRRDMPTPQVRVRSVTEGPRGSLEGRVRLTFPTAQQGPIILGRTRHFGGGLFAGAID